MGLLDPEYPQPPDHRVADVIVYTTRAGEMRGVIKSIYKDSFGMLMLELFVPDLKGKTHITYVTADSSRVVNVDAARRLIRGGR